MTKYYEVGEIVRNISNGCYNEGDELIILKDDRGDSIPLLCHRIYDGREDWVGRSHVERVNPDNPRLTEAEAKIAALEAEVKSLKASVSKARLMLGADIAQGTDFTAYRKTPNQRRADVIKRAQAFVADLERRAMDKRVITGGNDVLTDRLTALTFHVNAEKGVVTALAKGAYTDVLRGKAFAKCAPGDVFNADIGKAIAAGRLYGVDIPKEFFNAPQPTEVVVGMRIRMQYDGSKEHYERDIKTFEGNRVRYTGGGFDMRTSVDEEAIILDDTDAVYV